MGIFLTPTPVTPQPNSGMEQDAQKRGRTSSHSSGECGSTARNPLQNPEAREEGLPEHHAEKRARVSRVLPRQILPPLQGVLSMERIPQGVLQHQQGRLQGVIGFLTQQDPTPPVTSDGAGEINAAPDQPPSVPPSPPPAVQTKTRTVLQRGLRVLVVPGAFLYVLFATMYQQSGSLATVVTLAVSMPALALAFATDASWDSSLDSSLFPRRLAFVATLSLPVYDLHTVVPRLARDGGVDDLARTIGHIYGCCGLTAVLYPTLLASAPDDFQQLHWGRTAWRAARGMILVGASNFIFINTFVYLASSYAPESCVMPHSYLPGDGTLASTTPLNIAFLIVAALMTEKNRQRAACSPASLAACPNRAGGAQGLLAAYGSPASDRVYTLQSSR